MSTPEAMTIYRAFAYLDTQGARINRDVLLRRAPIRTAKAYGGDLTKAELARWAAVSRPTPDAWLRERGLA